MSDIVLTVSVLALVAVVGLWIGNVKVRGVGLVSEACCLAVLSIVGHFVDQSAGTCSVAPCCTLFRNSA